MDANIEEKQKNGFDNLGYEKSFEDGHTSDRIHEKDETDQGSKPDKGRDQWSRDIEFLLSCMASAVGLGNMWRFPVVAYENGGGAFLIPYLIVLILIGRPLYYMEMALGQFSSRANVKAYGAIARPLQGNGYGQLVATFGVVSYYGPLIALSIFYFVNSFTGDLPWAECRKEWDTGNMTCVDATMTAEDLIGVENAISSSELYFTKEVLREIRDISNGIGEPEWRLILCLLGVWAVTFGIIFKGVKSSGKAAYFLAIFPYVIIIVLLIRAVTLDGAGDGIMYFIKPKWEKLASASVWYTAVSQCFFSLSVGQGPVIMFSSFNNFNHNIWRDTIVLAFLDTTASILAGCTIFGILGNLALQLNKNVDEVINTGSTGLAFISYPDAISKFDQVPWLFALLFFFMLFLVGLGSLTALQSCINTAILDQYPKLKKWHVAMATCTIGFLSGIIYITPGGQHLVKLVDNFGGTFAMYVTVIIEVCTVMWFYGLENFCLDVEFMLKRKVGVYWRISWGLITPVCMIVILIYFIATFERLEYGGVYLPDEALAFGWCLLAIASVQVPIWTAYYVYKNKEFGFKKALKISYKHDKWGPKNPELYSEWKAYKEEALTKKQNVQESWLRHKARILLRL